MTDDTTSAEALAQCLVRNWIDIEKEREVREPLYDSVAARLAAGTAARKLGASITTIAPGKRSCPYHAHHVEEEMFVVLAGSGTMRVAGHMLPLRTGDVVFIPPGPEYPHQVLNTSDAPLTYLAVSTREGMEIVEYPDSDKVLAAAGVPGAGFRMMRRRDRAENLDYWDGEP